MHFSYPDVMMPAYNRSRWSVIYFAVYISVTLYFVMNLVRKNYISFLSLTGKNEDHIFYCNTRGFLFIVWLCSLQSWKLHVIPFFFSTTRARFMPNVMQFYDKTIVIANEQPRESACPRTEHPTQFSGCVLVPQTQQKKT